MVELNVESILLLLGFSMVGVALLQAADTPSKIGGLVVLVIVASALLGRIKIKS